MDTFKYLMRHQWPFWLGGLVVGISEILFYLFNGDFIVVTTGFAQMYATTEHYVMGLDWIAQIYEPGIHWTIIGALLGARLVGIFEKDVRGWVRYNWRMIALAFVGGMLFSFGTRLSAGCTTHHFMGGLPAMSIASWVVLFSGIPFAFLAFKLTMKMELAGYFRHQETKSVAQQSHGHDIHPNAAYDPNYNPWTDPLRIILNGILLTFLLVPLYFALFSDTVIMGSLSEIRWAALFGLLIPGFVLGFGIAKSGFGTECSVMAPESVFIKKETYCGEGLPLCTYRMFRSMAPLQGFMMAIVVFNIFLLAAWLLGIGSMGETGEMLSAVGDSGAGLYWGHIVGGPLLAIGAVFMIGCEVRTYARLGLGYMTALAALPGFFIGYIPYTLNKEAIDDVMLGEGLTDYIWVNEWLADILPGGEVFWAFMYSFALLGILFMSFNVGRRFFKTTYKDMLSRNTDELVYSPEMKCEPMLKPQDQKS